MQQEGAHSGGQQHSDLSNRVFDADILNLYDYDRFRMQSGYDGRDFVRNFEENPLQTTPKRQHVVDQRASLQQYDGTDKESSSYLQPEKCQRLEQGQNCQQIRNVSDRLNLKRKVSEKSQQPPQKHPEVKYFTLGKGQEIELPAEVNGSKIFRIKIVDVINDQVQLQILQDANYIQPELEPGSKAGENLPAQVEPAKFQNALEELQAKLKPQEIIDGIQQIEEICKKVDQGLYRPHHPNREVQWYTKNNRRFPYLPYNPEDNQSDNAQGKPSRLTRYIAKGVSVKLKIDPKKPKDAFFHQIFGDICCDQYKKTITYYCMKKIITMSCKGNKADEDSE